MEVNSTAAKQPAPSVGEAKNETAPQKPARKYNRPSVGVVDVPNISKTPIEDTLVLKKKEYPRMKYKYISTKGKIDRFAALLSVSTVALGIMAAFGFRKK